VIVCVTKQLLGCKPLLDRLRRQASFAHCQMLLCPGEEARQTWRRSGLNLCREHANEAAQSIQFIKLGQHCAESGYSTVFDVLDACRQFAPLSLLLRPSLFRVPPEALLSFCRGENRKPHGDLARHVLESLDFGVAEAAARCRSSKRIDLLKFERELAGRMVIPFGKSWSVEECGIPGIAVQRVLDQEGINMD